MLAVDQRSKTSLQELIKNPSFSQLGGRLISADKFMDLVASSWNKKNSIELTDAVVLELYEKLNQEQKDELKISFPRSLSAFSNFLAFSLLQLCEMPTNQARFAEEMAKCRISNYSDIFHKNALYMIALIPCSHVIVFRRNNKADRAVMNKEHGCSHISKFHYLLTGLTKHYSRILLLVMCSESRQEGPVEELLNRYFHPMNFRSRMEETRIILREHCLSSHDQDFVQHTKKGLLLLEHIGQLAESAPPAEPATRHIAGIEGQDITGELYHTHISRIIYAACSHARSLARICKHRNSLRHTHRVAYWHAHKHAQTPPSWATYIL